MIAQGFNTTMALSMLPSQNDTSWIVGAPNFTNTSSQVMIGNYNRAAFIDTTSNKTLTLTSNSINQWVFNVTMGFGLTNTSEGLSNATEFYTNITYNVTSGGRVTLEYNQVLVQTSFPGMGVA